MARARTYRGWTPSGYVPPRQNESIKYLTRTLSAYATKPLTPEAVEIPLDAFALYYIIIRIVLAQFTITHPFSLNY